MMALIPINRETDISLCGMQKSGITVLYFWAPWCEPCDKMKAHVMAAADSFGEQVDVLSVNVDVMCSVVQQYDVAAVPAILFFQRGKLLKRLVGSASQAEIEKVLANILHTLA